MTVAAGRETGDEAGVCGEVRRVTDLSGPLSMKE